jgi:hypothetical protein
VLDPDRAAIGGRFPRLATEDPSFFLLSDQGLAAADDGGRVASLAPAA